MKTTSMNIFMAYGVNALMLLWRPPTLKRDYPWRMFADGYEALFLGVEECEGVMMFMGKGCMKICVKL